MTTSNSPVFGYLASEYAQRQLPISVLESAAGFYIGTFDPKEGPCSRESVEYYPTAALARSALDQGTWTQRDHP